MLMKESLRKFTVCFTGHRHIPDDERHAIMTRLRETVVLLISRGYRYFGTGGALGFDTLAAETVLSLRDEYPHIKLILVLPCKDQTAKWRDADVRVYNDILTRADKVRYVCEEYTNGCMLMRNRHLVDNSSVCVCYLTKTSGGAAYTARYAKECGCEVKNLI